MEKGKLWRVSFARDAQLLQVYQAVNIFISSSYQIPRASGQSLAIPAAVSRGDTGLSNRKCSYQPVKKEDLLETDRNSDPKKNKTNSVGMFTMEAVMSHI